MGRDRISVLATLWVFLAALAAAPLETWAADDPKTKGKEKGSDKTKEKSDADDGIQWSSLLEITARAPSFAAGTYQATKQVAVDEKILKFSAKLESAEGKGGNMVITIYRQGKPVKKIPVMKHNRDGEKEVIIQVEPGTYKFEVSVNNVSASVSVMQGKKK